MRITSLTLSHCAATFQELLDDTALEESGAIRYRPFLARYRVTHEDTSWQSDLLGSLLGVLTKKDLGGTLAFFDVNQVLL